MGRIARRIGLGLGLLVLAVASVPVVTVVPLVRDDLWLDRLVVAVALDWRDFGIAKAQERLQYEFDRQAIGAHVRDDDCALTMEAESVRRVHCAWEVSVQVPGIEGSWPLRFASSARIDRHGVLLR